MNSSNYLSEKRLRGPDLSEFNENIDFSKLKSSVDFVILRCGYGGNYPNQEDAKFEEYSSQCEKYGIPYGVYLYSYAENTAMAKDEADHALSLIKGKNISYGVWYDLEDDNLPNNATVMTDIALAFCEKIENAGYFSGIYTSLSWINNRFDRRISSIHKWIAQWNDTLDYSGEACLWQFTNHAELDGISYSCDCNLLDESFFTKKSDNKSNTESNSTNAEKTLVVTSNIGLNVRKKPNEKATIKDTLKFGEIIKITESKSDGSLVWGKLSFPKKFKNCYVAISYCGEVESVNKEYSVTPKIGLNVRSAPSTDANKIKALKEGTKVKAKYKYSNWMKITSPVGGWVCADYLK